jgi:hypothetical protein
MNLYLSRDGQTFGPYTVDQAREYLVAGQFFPNDYALFEGETEWKPLGELLGIQTEHEHAVPEPNPVPVVPVVEAAGQTVGETTVQEESEQVAGQSPQKSESSRPTRKKPKKITGINKGQSVVVTRQRSLGSKIFSTFIVFLVTAILFGGIVTGLYFAMPQKIGPILAKLGIPVGEEKTVPGQDAESVKKVEPATPGEMMLDEEQAQRLRGSGIRILPVKGDEGLQAIPLMDPESPLNDDDLIALVPVAHHLVFIDLTQSKITDRGLGQLVEMKNLKRLTLEGVKEITPKGIGQLKPLENLTFLNLVRVPLDDSIVDVLIGMENLREVYLYDTGLSESAVSRLKIARPKMYVKEG